MKPLFIIPARGGSKGIPHKNIKPLGGRPLIAHSIAVALYEARRMGLDRSNVLVSTDSPEIAAVAAEAGAPTTYLRPAELATDKAGSREVMLHAADWARSQGIDFDCSLLLQPTSPFRTADDIRGCVELLEGSDADMAVSVCEAPANPYFNIFEPDSDGFLHISKGDGTYCRRQDAPPAWIYNGAVYAIRPASLRAMPLGQFPKKLAYVMPAERSVDIDGPLDWLTAETLMNLRR